MLAALFRPSPRRVAVLAAYDRIVARARDPRLYRDWAVPDTLEGRFEVLALHVFLVLRRLRREPEAASFAQLLFDTLFADLDRSLREMGVGDLGVGRRVKALARQFYGRIAAYEKGLAGASPLDDALGRNLYRGAIPSGAALAAVAAYMRGQAAALAGEPVAALLAGEIGFAPIEAP
jgi:cytochrome b pre-mRNA-processing protein 3